MSTIVAKKIIFACINTFFFVPLQVHYAILCLIMYKPSDKMSELMGASDKRSSQEPQVLQLINRFGLPLGVGEKSIEAICNENDVDCATLLAVINYALTGQVENNIKIHVPTLRKYLENAHTYFMGFQLPRIRQTLLEAINLADSNTKIPLLIIQFFDEYVSEIRTHIQHENECCFEQHPTDDKHIAQKAHELKKLIVKYYPNNLNSNSLQANEQTRLLYAALHELYNFEKELALHCDIEDNIMLPAIVSRTNDDTDIGSLPNELSEELSSREIEVLTHIVKGLSNKEIADVLCLSTHTVISHRKNIIKKLNIHSTAGLTIYAIVHGIIPLSEDNLI